ncbi:type I restriction enzyme endonuclease domain-containing protein [Streptomyces scopuliridis]|uniref:type I restriction enzyme endonuclease domain-containing protein n=1 Tax=Streptomyces scopuliridis TaxID=452529 RepID=UPI0036AA3DE3
MSASTRSHQELSSGDKFSPPLDWRELAFYDEVADHGTARSVMGDEVLAGIARELVRARLRSAIKRLLARHMYPPDQEVEAINLVLKQMEHFADEWSTTCVSES